MTHHKQPVLLLVLALLLLLQAEANKLIAPSYAVGASPPPAVPCLPGQAAALLRLKRSFATTDASVRALASWRAGTDCCRWDGVRCGGHGLVTWLDLGGRGLQSAALDPAIFNLTSLRYLNLAYKDFSMSKLPSIGFERLALLTHLNLSNANFSGAIPAYSIGHLSVAVHYRDFADYGYGMGTNATLRLVLPNLELLIANLTNLRELRLGSAAISDNGTEWCSALAKYTPNLRVLSLPFCFNALYPSTSICESFSGLRSLAILDLRYNDLFGPIPDFFAFSSLRVLQLNGNDLQGWFPSTILQQKKLVTVDISRNPGISGNLPKFPADGSSLENLLVGGTKFSGEIPSSIGNLKSLKKLDLGATSFSFSSNGAAGFFGTVPPSIGKLRSLELLAFSGFGLVGSIMSWIGNLTSLTILKLSNCGLSGSVPSSIGNLKKLRELTLSNCKLYGNIPSSISNLTQLDILDLQSNDFFGTVEFSLFMRLPNLSIFSLK